MDVSTWQTRAFAATLVVCLASAMAAGQTLFLDDFEGTGPLDTQAKWRASGNVPQRLNGTLAVTPGSDFCSQQSFGEPISVVFKGVHLAQANAPSLDNHIGITPGHAPNMLSFRYSQGKIYAFRQFDGKPYGRPKNVEAGVPVADIGPYDLRIDWWPGELVRYYLNDKLVGEYADHVTKEPLPVGVRDEAAYFRINSVKVTKIDKSAEQLIGEKRKQEEDAARGREEEARARLAALSKARVEGLSKQFKKMRMVIGGPCYFYGIDPVITDDLKAAGMEVLVWPDAPMLDANGGGTITREVTTYNVIIFGDSLYYLVQPDPDTGQMPDRIKAEAAQLKRFLEAGGGVWFSGLGEHTYGRSYHALNYILKEIGLDAEVVNEVVLDKAVLENPTHGGGYAWAEVHPDPLTEGVKNVLHPHGVLMPLAYMAVVPVVKLGPDWRVLLRGAPSSASYPLDPDSEQGEKVLPTPGAAKSTPVLAAVREVGKGRVVLWPTGSQYTVTGGSACPLVDGERDAKTSDGARLIENLLCWLAEASQGSAAVGIFDPEKHKVAREPVNLEARLKNWASPGRRDWPNQYKGLVGAHSNLSDGKSTPEEMIAAAKKAGYDFIAFTENFAKMDEAKWKQLLAVCDKVNGQDPNFRAYPGLDFLDEAGDRCVVFGQRWWIKDAWRSKQYPDRIRWWYQVSYAADGDVNRWPPRVIIRSGTNNKRPWYQGLYSFLATYCYEGGKLVDDSMDEYRQMIGPAVLFLSTGHMAVHTVHAPDEIAASARPGLHQTWVRASNLDDVLARIKGCMGRPGAYFPCYVSAGPEIVDFCRYIPILGTEESFDLGYPENDRGLLHILVESKAGLREVAVYDRERLVRRYQPQGNQFETFMTFHPDEFHVHTITVTDQQGRTAVSWPAPTQIQERVHRRCTDNYAYMSTGKGPGTLRQPKFGFHLLENTGAWQARRAPVKDARPTVLYGMWRYCRVDSWQPVLRGRFIVDGNPWEAPWPADAINYLTIGRYGTILRRDITDYLVTDNLEPYMYAQCAGPYPVSRAPWIMQRWDYSPMGRPDSLGTWRYRGVVKFTRTVSTPEGGPLGMGVTHFPFRCGREGVLEVGRPDGEPELHPLRTLYEGKPIQGEIPVNGYIAWYGPDGPGVGGIISLEPGLKYNISLAGDLPWLGLAKLIPVPAEPGTEAVFDVVIAPEGMSDQATNTNQPVLDVWQGMGIAGKPTHYAVEPRLGRIADQKYFLTLEAEDGAFSGKIAKTTGRPLPVHLPVMVKGLNARWSAGLWYRGKTDLHYSTYYRDDWGTETWRWVVAKYLPRADEFRYIPVLDGGIGYCTVDIDKQDPDVFIGHPLVCDQPEVFLTVVKAEKGKCTFEINNPTDRSLNCTVRPAKGFDLIGAWEKKLPLPAGGYQVVTVMSPLTGRR